MLNKYHIKNITSHTNIMHLYKILLQKNSEQSHPLWNSSIKVPIPIDEIDNVEYVFWEN